MCSKLTAAITFIFLSSAIATACAQVPAYAPRPGTMTSDPRMNFALSKYGEPLPDQMAAVAKTITLFKVMSNLCRDVSPNKHVLDDYVKKSGFFKMSPADANIAGDQGAAALNGLDYDDLVHLCVGSDYLFGPRGVLVRGAMSKGSGRVKLRYDPGNPYVRIVAMHFG